VRRRLKSFSTLGVREIGSKTVVPVRNGDRIASLPGDRGEI
jgi:hypothetical protein